MNLLLPVVIVLFCIAVAIAIGARLVTRADQRRRAQADFAGYMEAVFLWSEHRHDLSKTQLAMEAIDIHKLRIQQIRQAAEKDLYISRARRDYLEEYARLQRRHNALVKRSRSRSAREAVRQDKTYLMATRFQEAVISLARGSQTRTS